MSDRLEQDLRDWLDERGAPDPLALSSVVARIDTLPDRRRGPRRSALWAVVGVALVIGVALIVPRLGGPSTGTGPVPPDPAAFAADPRLAHCFGAAGQVEFAFEMPRARDYQRHFPAMLLSPELDVDDSAFVVVFAAGVMPAVGGGGLGPTDDASAGGRAVCILAGDWPNLYTSVDITGMQVDIGTTAVPATPTAPPTPIPSESPTPTPEPAPNWTADVTGQLQCDGPPSLVGGELDEQIGGEAGSPESPEAGLEAWSSTTMFSGLPKTAYVRTNLEGHWARFAYAVAGETKAIVILSDTWSNEGVGWTPVALVACDAAEFEEGIGLTGVSGPIWRDGQDRPVPTTVLRELQGPEHCGWESTIWLSLDGDWFIRDPLGVLSEHTVGAFDPDATLPKGAMSTGFHDQGRTIWGSSDPKSIYVVMDDGTERWFRLDPGTGCV